MRLLVTGGAGYIGSVTSAVLLAEGHEVTVLDDLSTGHRDAVPDSAAFVHADVADAGEVLSAGGYDGVVHFAAKSLVGESVDDPALYWGTNVVGTFALLEAMREHGVRRLVFSSTAAVYGEPETVPIAESAPVRPTNPYGAAKLAVDQMIGAYARAYGLAAVSLRYFNVAGAHGRFGERHERETHLIPLVIHVAQGLRDAVSVYGTDWPTPDGTCMRDYIHVSDLARAHLLALEAAAPGQHHICNLGNGTGFSVRDVVDTARRVTGHPIPILDAPRREGDPAILVASAERAGELLGWVPELPDLAAIIGDAWRFHSSASQPPAASPHIVEPS